MWGQHHPLPPSSPRCQGSQAPISRERRACQKSWGLAPASSPREAAASDLLKAGVSQRAVACKARSQHWPGDHENLVRSPVAAWGSPSSPVLGVHWQPPGWACRETLEDRAWGTQPSHNQVRDSSILAASLERGRPVEAVLGLFCSPEPGLCLGNS